MVTEKKETERGVGALDRSCIIIMYNVMCNSVEDASITHYNNYYNYTTLCVYTLCIYVYVLCHRELTPHFMSVSEGYA